MSPIAYVPDLAVFEADRRAVTDRAVDALTPKVRRALRALAREVPNWDPVMEAGAAVWLQEFFATYPGGDPAELISEFIASLGASLGDTTPPDPETGPTDGQVDLVSTFVAVLAINAGVVAAVLAAGRDEPDPVIGGSLLQWVTMQDGDVRPAHAAVNGQVIEAGSTFTVDGYSMAYPGDPTAPAALWANCRCVARPVTEDIVAAFTDQRKAGRLAAFRGFTTQASAPPPSAKPRFEGVALIEGTPTGDGRLVERGALRFEEESYPLVFSLDGDQHSGTVVGTIDEVRRDGDLIRIAGSLDTDSEVEAVRSLAQRVTELTAGGNAQLSVGLDDETVEVRIKAEQLEEINESIAGEPVDAADTPPETDEDGRITVWRFTAGDELWAVTDARLRHVAVVTNGASLGSSLERVTSPDAVAASLIVTTGAGLSPITAAGGVDPFVNPQFGTSGDVDPRLVFQARQRPEETDGWGCPLTVEDDGRIYGHLALDSRCHGAYAACVNPPNGGDDFSMFLTGEARKGTPTGPLILATTHSVRPDGSVKSYDWLADTGQAVADLNVGRDAHGVWVAGMLRPGVSKAQVAQLRGSALSGEWLPYGPNLRLAGILAVNGPGYLIQRAVAASGGLVTVGPACCDKTDPVSARLDALENAAAAALRAGVL